MRLKPFGEDVVWYIPLVSIVRFFINLFKKKEE